MAVAPQPVERPQHTGGPDVEVLHRARPVPAVPLVRPPEELRPAPGLVRVAHERSDPFAHALLVPGLLRQLFERVGLVEHA